MNTESAVSQRPMVLVVDDDPDTCEALGDLLEHEGYRVHTVHDGTEAIQQVRQLRYEAVLLDMRLPNLDGLSVLKTVMDVDPKLPVIILTAYASTENKVDSLSKGAFAYVAKPYNQEEVTTTLRRAIAVKILAVKSERVETALHESEERFRSVVQSATDAIVVADQNGRILSWNKSAQRLFLYTEDEVAGQSLAILMPACHREAHQRGVDRMRSTGESRVIGKTIELRGLKKDGSEFPLELSLASWKTTAGTFYSGIIRDITERKQAEDALRQSEERFRQVTENIKEVFWMTEPEKNTMLYVSPAYEEIWGRTCESLYASPRSWLDAIDPADRQRVLEAALTKQITGKYDETYQIMRPDGTTRWIEDKAFPIRDASGTVYRIAGIATDITERKQIQDQLIQTEKLASLGTLVSGIAHEINNPVQGILGMAEIIQEEHDPEKVREYARDIAAYSKHVATIVRDFACYARASAHDDATALDLGERMTEAVKMVRRCPQFGRIDVVTAFQATPTIQARRTEIDQVFVNLISNAVQAMDGAGRLTLATRMEGTMVIASVADTGCGIPQHLLSKIFDPFFTTKDPGKGTGLGLSVVYKIVTKYGGAIGVESTEGHGTTFTVRLLWETSHNGPPTEVSHDTQPTDCSERAEGVRVSRRR
ncbi:MAG: PAS domain S-box protein [Nitrospirae bacterium]|nr:MAG: PAS domain S-box protein [Nitrospirota bacterium]